MATKSAPPPENAGQSCPTTSPVFSGPTGMDQSVQCDREPAPRQSNAGNCLPSVPPIKRGN